MVIYVTSTVSGVVRGTAPVKNAEPWPFSMLLSLSILVCKYITASCRAKFPIKLTYSVCWLGLKRTSSCKLQSVPLKTSVWTRTHTPDQAGWRRGRECLMYSDSETHLERNNSLTSLPHLQFWPLFWHFTSEWDRSLGFLFVFFSIVLGWVVLFKAASYERFKRVHTHTHA